VKRLLETSGVMMRQRIRRKLSGVFAARNFEACIKQNDGGQRMRRASEVGGTKPAYQQCIMHVHLVKAKCGNNREAGASPPRAGILKAAGRHQHQPHQASPTPGETVLKEMLGILSVIIGLARFEVARLKKRRLLCAAI